MPDTLLAILLLSAPEGQYEHPPAADDFPALRQSVHRVAIEWEILDPRETSYIFARPSDFVADLDLLRRRRADMADMPRLADAERLPERKVVNELVQFNRGYRKHVAGRLALELDRAEVLEATMVETDRLYKVWDAARDARCEFYYVTVRRHALARLRDLIGPEDFAAVRMPPNVPTWRFEAR